MTISKTKYTSQYIDNLSFDDENQLKLTELTNNEGLIINPSTSDNQDPLSSYKTANLDINSDPMYLGNVNSDGKWFIQQITFSTGTVLYCKGNDSYPTSWADRSTLTYDLFSNVF